MTDVLIKRELLERIDESAICDGTDATISDDLFTQLVAALAAPRQPGGEGLEVVAWQDAENPLYTTAARRVLHGWATDGYPIVELCRLSDAQRAIAELREECEHLKACQENAMLHMTGLVAERDNLRQQLAERDAIIERLEAGIPRLQEQAYQMRQQRDKLAGLLREVRVIVAREVERWTRSAAIFPVNANIESGLLTRIDAALAEVKP